ncbi:hypothetical protein MNBD_ALPHA08-1990 [hydrothermal vent metagenome]|uniref:Uncharacterized protein n=1 Tax=hydrothermal vent metagenome TaxID=652676 RepID=A0A3B0RFL7_9ZZZZ
MLAGVLTGFKWVSLVLVGLVAFALLPVAYVETFCRDKAGPVSHTAVITEKKFQRAEANAYLSYPKLHIVFAYEGLAKALETGDEYRFDYTGSVLSFWSSLCSLTRKANRHGGGELSARGTIYVSGVSFTAEMAMKALYEETIGRLSALLRGSQKTPQDVLSAEVAADYARFLQKVPWYKYDFAAASEKLWALPITSWQRSWERRLALGGEWQAKSIYAKMIAGSLDVVSKPTERTRSVAAGLDTPALTAIEGVEIIKITPDYSIIETPRGRKFTPIIQEIIAKGGRLTEIAGNDDIMLSAVGKAKPGSLKFASGDILSIIDRAGFDDQRVLLNVKIDILVAMFKELKEAGLSVERFYDY